MMLPCKFQVGKNASELEQEWFAVFQVEDDVIAGEKCGEPAAKFSVRDGSWQAIDEHGT